MSGRRMDSRNLRNLIISLLVSVAFLYLAFRNVTLEGLGHALSQVRPAWLIVAVGVSLMIQIFRAWRWQLELRPLVHVPFTRLWVIVSVAYMAINLLPVRLGEVVRPWLLSRRANVTMSNVVGNLVVEKTMDSLVILFYILVGLLTTENLPLWVRRGALFPAAGAAVLVTVVMLLWWRGEAFIDRWVIRYLPARVGGRVKQIAAAIVAGMQILPNPSLLLAVFLVSIALWFLPILSSYIMIRAFDLNAPFNAALVVFIFIGFGTALPQAPGMIGTYQYACILALALFGIGQTEALAYGLVLNALQLATLVAQGLVALPFAEVGMEDIWKARAAAREADPGGHDSR
jgi:glycosyltransferase 2 family protein